jgi:hypothetical protein
MNVVLVHPIHGAKIAINQEELDADVKNGWTEYNPDEAVEVVAEPEKVKRKYTRRTVEQPVEQPNEVPDFLTPVSEESEGK